MKRQENLPFRKEDIPLVKLKKIQCRKIDAKAFSRIRTSIKQVGIVEPLQVSPRSDGYYHILDGERRFDSLVELGYETAPCIIQDDDDMDTFTANFQVNHLSPREERRMIEKAAEVVDEKRIADVLGLKKISLRLPEMLSERLHPIIVKAFDSGMITRACTRELAEVVPKRQLEIFAMMQNTKNFGTQFVKRQVVATPLKQQQSKRKTSPWTENQDRKKSFGSKLKAQQPELDQCTKSYRDFTSSLMKAVIHCRTIITNKAIEKYLKANMLPIYTEIKAIIESEHTEKKTPR